MILGEASARSLAFGTFCSVEDQLGGVLHGDIGVWLVLLVVEVVSDGAEEEEILSV
jgi:hypothetical protein